jgi:16S rRNA (uracil1498-N3)-methyltransferase
MIEKLVEIGVERIILMHTSNTERTRTNLDRLEKKAVSAVKQSLRFYIPEVVELDYTQVLQLEADDKYIAHCYDEMEKGDPERDRLDFDSAQSDSQTKQLILIGPEGDFTTSEVQQAFDAGFKGLDLGEFRLRTETAAIVAVTRFQ